MELNDFIKHTEEKYNIHLPSDTAHEIRKLARRKSCKRKDIVSYVGDSNSQIMFLLSGLIRLFYIDIEGNDITKFFAQEGDILGGVSRNTKPYTGEVLEDCELLVMDSKIIMDMMMSDMNLLKLFNTILLEGLEYKGYRESSLLTLSATERYINFKNMHPGLEKRVNQIHIASYLGITPVSLSRIRKTIKENN